MRHLLDRQRARVTVHNCQPVEWDSRSEMTSVDVVLLTGARRRPGSCWTS
jgi:hypothetical protein